jgi:hypothetical protein
MARVSDKTQFRTFRIPDEFVNILSSQFTISQVPENALVSIERPESSRISSPELPDLNRGGGFTITFELNPGPRSGSCGLINGMEDGKGIKLDLLEDGSVLFAMSDGKQNAELRSNKGIITRDHPHQFALVVDGYPGLISMVIDRQFQDGGEERERGTSYFNRDFTHVNGMDSWELNPDQVSELRVYDRVLLTTEIIGLQRAVIKE